MRHEVHVAVPGDLRPVAAGRAAGRCAAYRSSRAADSIDPGDGGIGEQAPRAAPTREERNGRSAVAVAGGAFGEQHDHVAFARGGWRPRGSTSAVARRRCRSMKMRALETARDVPTTGQPATSDFAMNETGWQRADHRNVEPGDVVRQNEGRPPRPAAYPRSTTRTPNRRGRGGGRRPAAVPEGASRSERRGPAAGRGRDRRGRGRRAAGRSRPGSFLVPVGRRVERHRVEFEPVDRRPR